MIENINIERNKEIRENWLKKRNNKRQIYKNFEKFLMSLEEALKDLDDPVDKKKILLTIKKVKRIQKKYYVPSTVELVMSRRKRKE